MATVQEQFRAAIKKADEITAAVKAAGDKWTPEQNTEYLAAVKSAKDLQPMIEAQIGHEALKAWGNQTQGSAVAGGFAGEDVSFVDPAMMAMVEDPKTGETYITEDKSVPSEYKSLGAAKLKTLKSGAYKDAYVEYVRARGLGRAMKASAMKVLQEGVDTSGGFWVPPDIRSELIKKEATVPGVWNDVNKFTVGSDLVTFPQMVYTTDDLYTNGVRPSWSVEYKTSASSEATNPIAGLVEIRVYLLTATLLVSRSMVEDNVFDLLGFVTNALGENFPLFINNAIWNGSGSGQPQGIYNHPNAGTAHASAGMQVLSGKSNTLAFGTESGLDPSTQGILGTEASLPPQYETGAKWYGKKQSYAFVRGMVDGQGRPLWAQYDGFAPYVNGYPGTLIGYPIVKDQFADAIGDGKHPLALGQMKAYYCPQRVGLSVEVFRETYGTQDLVAIYARQRLGGKLVEDYRVKLLKSDDA